MKFRVKIGMSVMTVILAIMLASGQASPRLEGLEGNAKYMELLHQERVLQYREDSLSTRIIELRENFRQDTTLSNRVQFRDRLMQLENAIFDVRNRIGIVSGHINSIVQEYVISNLESNAHHTNDSQTPIVADSTQRRYADLVKNDLFEQQLSGGDYDAVINAQQKEGEVAQRVETYKSNYETMIKLASEYASAGTPLLADSIFNRYQLLETANHKVESEIDSDWSYIFDNKLYAYNYLLDRLSEMKLLYEFEKKGIKARDKQAQLREEVASPVVSSYGIEKKLLLDYEITLAKMLGLSEALDSLERVDEKIDLHSYNMPNIGMKERFFIDFESVGIIAPPKYNARNPIPKCVIYPRGIIYRILVGSYTRLQPVSTFRGIYPLAYVKDERGRLNYYAGGFETATQAEDAIKVLEKAGIKEPKIAVWVHGEYSHEANKVSGKGDTGAIFYRIEISGAGEDLSDELKRAIKGSPDSSDKEISRNGDMFTIGAFDSMIAAQRVVRVIKSVDEKLSIKTVEFLP